MRTRRYTTLYAALPFVAGLWLAPVTFAHDDSEQQQQYSYSYRSYSNPYTYSGDDPYTGRYGDTDANPYYDPDRAHQEEHYRLGEEHTEQHEALQRQYDKAMNRLARQEREAQEKAQRRYRGEMNHPRYRERLAEIDRKYDYKRQKVERNLAKRHAQGHEALEHEHEDYHSDWED